MPELGLNIDHVATLREARYRDWKAGLPPEPNVLEAARLAEQAGVDAITVHLREDRRHIQEADVRELSRAILIPLNLEMAATPAMTRQALLFKPEEVCLVPESREEVTTEGGLDVAADVTPAQERRRQASSPRKSRSAPSSTPTWRRSRRRIASGRRPSSCTPGPMPTPPPAAARRKELARHAPRGGPCARGRLAGQCRSRPALLQRPRIHRGRAASSYAEHRARDYFPRHLCRAGTSHPGNAGTARLARIRPECGLIADRLC